MKPKKTSDRTSKNTPKAIHPGELVTDTTQLPEYFLHRHQLAKRLQVSLRTVDRWMQRGHLPNYKVGNAVLFDWDEVCASLRSNFRLTPGGRHE